MCKKGTQRASDNAFLNLFDRKYVPMFVPAKEFKNPKVEHFHFCRY